MKRIPFIIIVFIALSVIVNAASSDYGDLSITLLNQDPDPAHPGKYVELRFKVEKQGNEQLNNITFKLEAEYPFYFDASDTATKTVGGWKGFSGDQAYYTLYYKLRVDPDALEDNYTIKLQETNDRGDVQIVREYNLRVNNDRPEFVLGNLMTSPTKLVGDTDEAEINVELQNIGELDAQNVIMSIELPEGFSETYGYSSRSNLGTIQSGNSKTATYYIDIDENIRGGTYNAKLVVEYKESGEAEYKSKILFIDIPVKSKPFFEIVGIETTPGVIHPGDEVELRIDINNSATVDADATSIRVFKESSQPFDFDDKTDYIGKLKSGQSGEGLLKFTVDSDAPAKTYFIDLEVRTIDGDDVIIQDKSIKIEVKDSEDNGVGLNPLVYVLIGAVLIIAGYYFYKSRTKRKKSRNK
ncbi:COG1361 S-layer family protein [Candidatus Woesearchaeota archaeon]|nr:COG1361 S-layer family protein [Candidatus Woesearchaeota archaeon]